MVGCPPTHRWELPPRARRILAVPAQRHRTVGTTSACAENTKVKAWLGAFFRNYLRVRGEYPPRYHPRSANQELPPRARRIPHRSVPRTLRRGTTSACAENTAPTFPSTLMQWNYLRVRGEYDGQKVRKDPIMELPPRARRIRHRNRHRGPALGTTSACAENTRRPATTLSDSRNYLRVRGEYGGLWRVVGVLVELPPRARRILSRANSKISE